MHRVVRDHLEEILGPSGGEHPVTGHLAECEECRQEVAAMRQQAAWLRQCRAADDPEPRPGFYARVMERIEAQGAGSIWGLFFESVFGRRIAVASLALALLLGVYLVSTEQMAEQFAQPEIANFDPLVELLPEPMWPSDVIQAQFVTLQDQPEVFEGTPDSVLVNLMTYREQ